MIIAIMKSYLIFFSIVFLIIFSSSLILNSSNAFVEPEKKSITIPPGKSDFIKIVIEKYEVIYFGFQISGRDDNQIKF